MRVEGHSGRLGFGRRVIEILMRIQAKSGPMDRSIRISLEHADEFKSHLRALLQSA